MPYAQLADIKLYYEIHGSESFLTENETVQKPTIVAIHGGPGVDHNYYDVPFLSQASEFAQVIFIDQRGNGRSIDNNSNNWNLKQWAEDIHSFCQVLGLEKPFIHGVSMGGWVAQLYASLYPEEPQGIILNDTEAFLDIDAILNKYEEKGGPQIRKIAEEYFYDPAEETMQAYFENCIPLCSNNPIPQAWLSRSILTPKVSSYFKRNELTKFNLMDKLKKIQAPVLYLTNTTNPLHLYSSAQKTAQAIDNADVEFVAFDDCGLVAMDKKEQALEKIQSFVLNNFNLK